MEEKTRGSALGMTAPGLRDRRGEGASGAKAPTLIVWFFLRLKPRATRTARFKAAASRPSAQDKPHSTPAKATKRILRSFSYTLAPGDLRRRLKPTLLKLAPVRAASNPDSVRGGLLVRRPLCGGRRCRSGRRFPGLAGSTVHLVAHPLLEEAFLSILRLGTGRRALGRLVFRRRVRRSRSRPDRLRRKCRRGEICVRLAGFGLRGLPVFRRRKLNWSLRSGKLPGRRGCGLASRSGRERYAAARCGHSIIVRILGE